MKDSPLIDHILGLEKRGMLFGLENIRSILEAIGNPEKSFEKIHVGGTNGKGSVTKILSSALSLQCYRTGRYTSPHLHSITERFSVNERDVRMEDFLKISEEIWKKIEDKGVKKSFSFFDFTTAFAFEYFSRESVKIAVIEVGLGGRLDSTNVIRPLVTIITNVSYDHMDYLGNSLQSIAKEKAGIIKENVPVVTGARGIPLRIIREVASEKKAPLHVLGEDFSFEKVEEKLMNYKGEKKRLPNLYVNLSGDHQLSNTSLALCALEILEDFGFPVEESKIREALSNVEWMGRLEVVKERPKIILDGAHNVDGMRSLTDYIKKSFRKRRVICVFGVMKDKDYRGMAKLLSSWAKHVIVTKPSMERALDVETLKNVIPYAHGTETVKEALLKAKELSDEEDIIVVTGSLFTVGEARTLINEIF